MSAHPAVVDRSLDEPLVVWAARVRDVEAEAMAEQRPFRAHGPTRYEIVVRGELSARFGSAFSGMTIHAEGGCTHIVGDVIDQSQLHGVLDRVRDLGIELISVTPLVEEAEGPPSSGGPAENEFLMP
jgi:hypothetical protein